MARGISGHSAAALIEASGFGPVLDEITLTCLDVGARGGFTEDLLPIARGVDAVGFEPDAAECVRLNDAAAVGAHPWRRLRFLSTALGEARGTRRLNLYRQRGCSSLLAADGGLAALFSRDDYYILDDTAEVATAPLDETSAVHGVEDASFIKLDVQGAELEILSGAQRLLTNALLALRVEVSFVPIYKGQPLFADIDNELRRYGFMPQRFLELHAWRRTTKTKLPELADGPLPYSQGQMIHGDVLYFRHPETMPDDGSAALEALLKAALLAIAYGHIDHAAAILGRPSVKQYLERRFGLEPLSALSRISKGFARSQRLRWPLAFKRLVRRLVRK